MVQLTEVVDEHFESAAAAEDDEDFTDTDSEISHDSDYDPINESFGDRLYALRDMVSPQTRGTITSAFDKTTGAIRSVLSFGGKTLWVVSSSALLLGVPWALAWAEEQQVMEMEKEMKMREMGGDLLTAGNSGSSTADQVSAAIGQEPARASL